jgi:hypothetical protein
MKGEKKQSSPWIWNSEQISFLHCS